MTDSCTYLLHVQTTFKTPNFEGVNQVETRRK